MTSFGIDFGTTNSVLAAARGTSLETVALDEPPQEWAALGFDRVLPTVIADVNGDLAFGWRAKRSPQKLEAVKRLFASEDSITLGNTSRPIEEVAGVFFRQIKRKAADAGLTVNQAVVTIPANSRGRARYRTKISAGLSGIEVLALVNEPTAAAMAYGTHIKDGNRVLVFDWGGGTLDVTVLRRTAGVFMEEASKGVQRLGGIDIDAAFADAVRSRVPAGSQLDLFDLERTKIVLSSQTSAVLPLVGGGTLELSRGDLEDAIRPLVVRTQEPVRRCLADLDGPKVDHLVLVGGSSKIPLVRRYISEMVGLDAIEGVDPMTAVAEGAALAAGILNGEITEYDFFVATEHSLGTIAHNRQDEPRFSVLIPRNTKLPAAATDEYSPLYDNQEHVRIQVIEGDPEQPFDHEDNVILKEWEVELLEARPAAEAGFTITFEYDVDGILHVKVVDGKTLTMMMDEQLTFGAARTKEDLIDIRRRIDATRVADPARDAATAPPIGGLSAESRTAVRRAKEKIYPFVDDATQVTIDAQVEALLHSGPDEEAAARDLLESTIREHAYLL